MTQIKVATWGKCLTLQTDQFSKELKLKLIGNGLHLVPLKSADTTKKIFIDSGSPWRFLAAASWREERYLVALEPPSVNPFQYSWLMSRLVSHRWVLSESLVKSSKDSTIWLGSLLNGLRPLPIPGGAERLEAVAVLNSNKVSFFEGERYSKRRNLINSLCHEKISVVLGGSGWSESRVDWTVRLFRQLIFSLSWPFAVRLGSKQWSPVRPSVFLALAGHVGNAHSFLAQHKFALVIENDPRYLSEKLISSVMAGCVTFYSGPSLESEGIPSSVAVQLRDGNELEQIKKTMASKLDQESILNSSSDWLNDSGHLFSFEKTWDSLAHLLAKECLGGKNDT